MQKAPRRRGKLRVGTKEISRISETKKLNPNSLRFIIGQLVNVYHRGNRLAAAKAIAAHGGVYQDLRGDREPKRMNSKALSQILNDEDYIQYWHIESIAKRFGFPAGVLLMLSRLYAHQEYGEFEKLDAAIEGLSAFCEVAKSLKDNQDLSEEFIENVKACFEKLNDLENCEKRLWDNL